MNLAKLIFVKNTSMKFFPLKNHDKMFFKAVMTRNYCSSVPSLEKIAKLRQQQLIKEKNEECLKVLPKGQFMLYHRGKPLLFKDREKGDMPPRLVDFAQTEKYVPNLANEAVFMKLDDPNDVPIFAAMIPKDSNIEDIEKEFDAKFTDMRLALFLIRSKWSGLMSGGSSLLRWLKSAKYCWTCKGPLQRNASGVQLRCTQCEAVFHPPTSPVGISLIASEDHSRALLIRQAMYPPGMYSCVAGFVDPGESLADCVARECAEEAGVVIDTNSLRMVGSNHWPNPAGSLMLGCISTTKDTNPSPCSHEIEAVRWFTPQELKEAVTVSNQNPGLRFGKGLDKLKSDLLFVPPRGAIANVIISTWLKEYHNL